MRECWEIRILGDICSSFSGYTPSGDLLCEVGAYPYFKVADMNRPENLKVMSSTDAFIDNPTKVYRKGAIVFPKNGAAISTNKKRILGQDSVVDLNTGGFLADKKLLSPSFLYYLMQHIDFKQYVRRGAVPTLDIKELKAKECCIPSIAEQEKIVAELDCLTGIIEKKKQQLEELDKLAQSIFYDMFGDPITNEKGWKLIPFEKSIEKVKYTRKLQSKEFLKEGRFPIISQEEEYISGYWNDESDVFSVSSPVVIFGDHTRVLKYVDFDFVLGADGVRILLPIRSISPVFLLHYLKACKIPSLGYSRHYKLLKEMSVAVPPLDYQLLFAHKVEAIEKQKELIKKSIQETETLFNSRMDYWFN